jgi:hypothetical protein
MLRAMIDAEDLACRYLHLWQDHLTSWPISGSLGYYSP